MYGFQVGELVGCMHKPSDQVYRIHAFCKHTDRIWKKKVVVLLREKTLRSYPASIWTDILDLIKLYPVTVEKQEMWIYARKLKCGGWHLFQALDQGEYNHPFFRFYYGLLTPKVFLTGEKVFRYIQNYKQHNQHLDIHIQENLLENQSRFFHPKDKEH